MLVPAINVNNGGVDRKDVDVDCAVGSPQALQAGVRRWRYFVPRLRRGSNTLRCPRRTGCVAFSSASGRNSKLLYVAAYVRVRCGLANEAARLIDRLAAVGGRMRLLNAVRNRALMRR